LSINQSYGSGKITFYTGFPNYERMRITSSGNVGIGVSMPAGKLEVASSSTGSSVGFNVGNSVSPERGNLYYHSDGTGWKFNIGKYQSGAFVPQMTFQDNGNIGIGTSNTIPYKLSVEGTIGARKLKITQDINWADYVFDKDYQLMPLLDVEKFIAKNKHLPEVPTTKEINEQGLDVAETQALLLKKIEELTLYMIELKKENNQLRDELNKVKVKIKK
jgi:hypothetical protein